MSTIESPEIIADLMRRGGKDPEFPDSLRHTVSAIAQYTTGFGNVAYKLFYPLSSNGMSEEESINVFRATANILPGTTVKFLMGEGQVTEYGQKWLTAFTIAPPVPR